MEVFSNSTPADTITFFVPSILVFCTLFAVPLGLLFYFADHRLSRRSLIAFGVVLASVIVGLIMGGGSFSYIAILVGLFDLTRIPDIAIDISVVFMLIAVIFAKIDGLLSQRVKTLYAIGVFVFVINLFIPYNSIIH